MTQSELGKLEEIVDLRSVWPHEAADFTPWLAEHIELLEKTVGLDITVGETEAPTGDFFTDILAVETGTEHKIIIENQLEESNHEHLGKIITYAAGKDANYVIWIVKHARAEHQSAIEWLNDHTAEDVGFFLCEIKLYRIDNSRLAPKFVIVAAPNDWKKEQRRDKKLSEGQMIYEAFWKNFNEYAWANKDFAKMFHKSKHAPQHWYSLYIGIGDAHIELLRFVKQNAINIQFYIRDNKELFDQLETHREDIEKETGLTFDWYRLDDKKASAIRIRENFVLDKKIETEGFDWLMECAIKIKKTFMKFC